MKKVKVTFLVQTLIQIEPGVADCIREGGKLYVLTQQEQDADGNAGATPLPPAPPAPAKATRAASAPKVVDDVPAAAPAARRTPPAPVAPAAAPAPTRASRTAPVPVAAPEPAEDVVVDAQGNELVEIPEAEWTGLNAGDVVNAVLNVEGDDATKVWEAEVVGWKKPKGSKVEKLHIF